MRRIDCWTLRVSPHGKGHAPISGGFGSRCKAGGKSHWQLGWRRPRKPLPALISMPCLSFVASALPFRCCHVAWEHIYIFWIGQLVLTPFPVSLAPGLWHSCLISTNGLAISGDYWSLFLSHWPPSLAEAPSCLPSQHRAWCLIAQFNTRTSEYINKTRRALPIFYMASERWIHAFLIMINAAVYYFYCSSGLNITSYLDAVQIHQKKMVSVSGRW